MFHSGGVRVIYHRTTPSVREPTVLLACLVFDSRYPDSWYQDITSNKKFFSLAATFRGSIVGMIVAEIKSRTKVHKEVGFCRRAHRNGGLKWVV